MISPTWYVNDNAVFKIALTEKTVNTKLFVKSFLNFIKKNVNRYHTYTHTIV